MCEGLKGGRREGGAREGEGGGTMHSKGSGVFSSCARVNVVHANQEACCSVVSSSWAAVLVPAEACVQDKCRSTPLHKRGVLMRSQCEQVSVRVEC